jgi:hypothetical protein
MLQHDNINLLVMARSCKHWGTDTIQHNAFVFLYLQYDLLSTNSFTLSRSIYGSRALIHCLKWIISNSIVNETIPSRTIPCVLLQLQICFIQTMTEQQLPEMRTAPDCTSSINNLIAATNKNDRFKLLEDDCAPAASLGNLIHPIFLCFNCDGPMKQMLHLATQFLTHNSVLSFFVPLLYGRQLKKGKRDSTQIYLSDPFAHASRTKREILFDGVLQALHCLAHGVEVRLVRPKKGVDARTLTRTARPVHTSGCHSVLRQNLTAVIEIADRFIGLYYNKMGTRPVLAVHRFVKISSLPRYLSTRLYMQSASYIVVTSLSLPFA